MSYADNKRKIDMVSLSVRNVSHTYGQGATKVVALDEVSFDAAGGDLVAVVGPSGCGKSTLLNIIGQVLVPTNGKVMIDGEAAPKGDAVRSRLRNAVFGYLFQDFALVENDTAQSNVEVPLRYSKSGGRRRQR